MKLKRELGTLDVFCIAAGAMISSGLFVLPGLAYAKVGPAVIYCYLLAGVLMFPAAACQAELATAMPKAGGTYFFIERSMGALAGTLGGLANWLSISLKSAFALVGIGAFLTLVKPHVSPWEMKAIAVGACLLFTGLNLLSVKTAGGFQVGLVAGLILLLALYIMLGLPHVSAASLSLTTPVTYQSLLATTGLLFISYGGLTKVASIGEEVRAAGRTLPRGMFLAFGVVNVLYVLVVLVTVGVTPHKELTASLTPISLGAAKFAGPWGSALMAIGGMMAFLTTANAGIMAASRSPMAMSRDGLLPPVFERVSERRGTPYIAILITSGFMIVTILFLDLEGLVKTASTLMLLLFVSVNASVIIMRESRLETYRPSYRAPLYPWIQMAAIIMYLLLILEMGIVPLAITAGFSVAGFLWYRYYAKGESRRSAIVHVAERIAAREIVGQSLERELKEILIERDSIVRDRFDRLVENCEILDVPGSPDMEGLFAMIAERLGPRLSMNPETFFERLMEREADSTTAIHPGLAIPHVIVEGEKRFDVMIARCKEGVAFGEDLPPVNLVFALAGSRDERHFHLRALMAIAQTVQEPHFLRDCLNARNAEVIRDIVLLSERRRDEPAE